MYCSCFQSAWKSHSAMKHSFPTKDAVGVSDSQEDYLISDSSIVVTANEEKYDWLVISNDKSYTPTDSDIGCIFRIEVSVFSVNDNTLITGPITSITEPVLAAPKAPPKRPLIAIPGALVGSSMPIARFRVVSYNILSELYATKQVNSIDFY